MAAAGTILVSMGEPAKKYVSPQVFGTAVLVPQNSPEDIVNIRSQGKAARPTKKQARLPLDCTQSLMIAIALFQYFVTLTLNPVFHGT